MAADHVGVCIKRFTPVDFPHDLISHWVAEGEGSKDLSIKEAVMTEVMHPLFTMLTTYFTDYMQMNEIDISVLHFYVNIQTPERVKVPEYHRDGTYNMKRRLENNPDHVDPNTPLHENDMVTGVHGLHDRRVLAVRTSQSRNLIVEISDPVPTVLIKFRHTGLSRLATMLDFEKAQCNAVAGGATYFSDSMLHRSPTKDELVGKKRCSLMCVYTVTTAKNIDAQQESDVVAQYTPPESCADILQECIERPTYLDDMPDYRVQVASFRDRLRSHLGSSPLNTSMNISSINSTGNTVQMGGKSCMRVSRMREKLMGLGLKQLRVIASERGLRGRSSMAKAQLVEALSGAAVGSSGPPLRARGREAPQRAAEGRRGPQGAGSLGVPDQRKARAVRHELHGTRPRPPIAVEGRRGGSPGAEPRGAHRGCTRTPACARSGRLACPHGPPPVAVAGGGGGGLGLSSARRRRIPLAAEGRRAA